MASLLSDLGIRYTDLSAVAAAYPKCSEFTQCDLMLACMCSACSQCHVHRGLSVRTRVTRRSEQTEGDRIETSEYFEQVTQFSDAINLASLLRCEWFAHACV